MSLKESNEITVKIKGNLKEFYRNLEEKGFRKILEFSMDDTYFILEDLDITNMSTREILSKAILVRNIVSDSKTTKNITFKMKNFDKKGNILSQKAVCCDVLNIKDAMSLLNAIGYKKIMNIKENDIVYEKEKFEIAVKDIENGDKLIEVETTEDEELDSIEKIINKINEFEIPIYKDNYFVKKAEIELNKILNK